MTNKYPLSLRDWWRYRIIGNRWASRAQRRDALKTAGALGIICLCYGIAGRLDYETQLASESITHQASADQAERILLDCLNGRARWIAADQKSAIVCEPAGEIAL